MAEPTLEDRLRDLCDEHSAQLQGLICAAYGVADALYHDAKAAGSIGPGHIGLRYVIEQAEEIVGTLRKELELAHRQAS